MTRIYIIVALAGLLATGGAIGGAYLKGRSDGYSSAEADARQKVIEQLTERNSINESVSHLSSADLCAKLGGVFKDGQCE